MSTAFRTPRVSTYVRPRAGRRAALVGAAALTAVLALAGPAAAHAEVEADKPQALAENVALTFVSEAESDEAGFTELRVVLPEGIAPGDVRLTEAPKGWKLKATDDGYTVGGPAMKVGVDAEHTIQVRQLPDAKEVAFRTVEVYEDGKISRWIELPTGGEEPEQPAPVLRLKAAAPGAEPVGPAPGSDTAESTTPTPTAPASEPAAEVTTGATESEPASDSAAAEDDGGSAGPVIGGVAVALLLAGGGVWWLIRRRGAATQS
ncbi:DUF1775 domain-containing protein [Streptomyces brasiliscabiei]|uniref:DUF1775 domain-containing protein n=1 Tax=Streptomyces brasiliscabiei TaxID=2736302 RepID=UPI003F682AA5